MSAQFSIRRGAGIIMLRNAPVNSLSQKLRDGILRSLDEALKAKCPAVVLTGDGKTFSAGADITEFAKGTYDNPPNLRFVIQQLDNFPIPLVAYVNGPALGGGLETALACHWRIGSTASRVALPEVHLGILPGAGGTQRLPRLLGVRAAVELMTSGRTVGPNEALKLGILDKLIDSDSSSVSHELMIDSAVNFALGDTVQSTPIMERKLSARPVPGGLPDSEFEAIFESVQKEGKGFLAPESIAHAARGAAIAASFDAGLALEGALFQALFKGSQAKALQYIFFAERRARKVVDISDGVLPRPIHSVGLLGYGHAGLVASLAAASLQVRWAVDEDADVPRAKRDLELCLSSLGKSSKSVIRNSAKNDIMTKLQNVQVSSDRNVLLGVDCSINCSSSSQEINTEYKLIASAARKLRDFGSRSATNIDISFPIPISHQRLMEIVRDDDASPRDVVTLINLGETLGKIPIVTKSPVGRRMLSSTILEALKLVDEGASPRQIDNALKLRIGYRRGPFEVLDLIGAAGVDRCIDLRSCDPSNHLPVILAKLYERGWNGCAVRQGWYKYTSGDERTPIPSEEVDKFVEEYRTNQGLSASVRTDISDEEIVERCMYPAVNEALSALESGSVMRPDDIDVLYVYGYGFPKFRGGILWWAEREVKLVKIMSAFVKYEKKFPDNPRWNACNLLRSCVASGAPVREEMYFMKVNKSR